MKAITLWQPWASLIMDVRKIVETRPMPWYYEGLVAIHAGRRVDDAAAIRFGYNPFTLPYGAILGIVRKTGLFHFEKAFEENEALTKGLNLIDGKVVCLGVAESFGMPSIKNPFEKV